MGQRSKIKVSNDYLKKTISGAAVALLATVVCTGICATAISKEMITQENAGYCAIGILLTASLCAATVSTTKDNEKKINTILISGAIYTGMLIVINTLFFEGKYQGVAVTIIVILTGGLLSVLVGRKDLKKRRSVRSKNRRR